MLFGLPTERVDAGPLCAVCVNEGLPTVLSVKALGCAEERVVGDVVVQLIWVYGAELHEQACGRKRVEAGRDAQIVRKPSRREVAEIWDVSVADTQKPTRQGIAGFDRHLMQVGGFLSMEHFPPVTSWRLLLRGGLLVAVSIRPEPSVILDTGTEHIVENRAYC